MIDYQKLEVAHRLADKYAKQINECIDVSCTLNRANVKFPIVYSWKITGVDDSDRYLTIDDLIAKLEELVKPEPRFKSGDKVWVICYGDDSIGELNIDEAIAYGYSESEVFPTRQALIENQLQYWSKLLQEECKHPKKDLQQDGKFDCDDCGAVGMSMSPAFEGEIKGFQCQHQGRKIDGSIFPATARCPSCGQLRCANGQCANMHCDKTFKCKKCGEFYR